MNISLTSLFLTSAMMGVVLAQETEPAGVPMPARVIGGISDGRLTPPAPPKVLPDYEVRKRRIVRKGGQKITLNRVVPPARPVALPVEPPQKESVPQHNTLPRGGSFMVYATTYDDRLTYVKWNHDGRMHEAWSNVNFKFLEGVVTFEGRGKEYMFMMLNGGATFKQLRKAKTRTDRLNLPEIVDFTELEKRKTAAYILMKGDETDEASMDFIEAIHDLYEAEQQRLIAAHRERQKNSIIRNEEQERLRLNPPLKPDVIVNYWKKPPEPKKAAKEKSTPTSTGR